MPSRLSIRHPRATATSPPGIAILELGAACEVYPVQVVLYPQGPPQVIEATGQEAPDGQVTITLPNAPPPTHTPIRIILYDGQTPTAVERVTTPAEDGIYGISIPIELTD